MFYPVLGSLWLSCCPSVPCISSPSMASISCVGIVSLSLLLTLLAVLASTPVSADTVRVGVVVPNHWYLRRRYNSAMTRALNLIRRRDTILTQLYNVEGEVKLLDEYSPPELLDTFCDDVLAKEMNAILYMSNTDYEGEHTASGQYMLQVSNFLGVPVIAWNGDNSGFFQPTAESIILQMAPSIEHQCRAMLSLLQRYNWHAFSIVTGSMAGEVHFINNMRELADESHIFEILAVISIPKPSRTAITEQLEKLKKSETRVILLYSSRKEAEMIFEVARPMDLMGKEFVWMVAQSIVGDITKETAKPTPEFPIGMFGIYFEIEDTAIQNAIGRGVAVWAQGMEALLMDKATRPSLYNVTLKPSLECNSTGEMMHWKDGRILYDYIRNVTIDDEFPPVSFNEDGIISDTELRVVNVNSDHEWEEIGLWNMQDGITVKDITWPGDVPTPPKGRPSKYHLKVVTIQEHPYVIYSDPDPKTGVCPVQAAPCRIAPINETLKVPNATANSSLYQCCSGLCIDLLKILSEKIGFDFDLFQVEDNKFGAYVKDKGEWNGLVRALIDRKADMSLASLSITEDRNREIDFSVPFLETGITIIVAVRDGVISPTAFLEPFDILSWIFILLMCIHIVAVTVFLFEWLSPTGYDLQKLPPREPYDYPSWCLILVFSVHASGAAIFIFEWLSPSGLDRGNKPIREHRFSLFRSFWLIWAMLFGAAVNTDNPRGVSSRFMANIWALFAVVFTASYTANLAAFMITKEDYDKLSGLTDWRLMNPYAHKPPFKFATVPHGSTEANLRKNYPDMYRYMRPYNKSSVKVGVRSVKDHEINAFIYDATVLEYLAGHDDGCKLRTVGNWYAMTGYGLGFPQDSKWLTVVNRHLIELQHNGEMERLQKFWLAGACSLATEAGESSQPLGILNFTSAFILLAGGMLLGGLLLLLEHIYFKFFRRKLRKWDKCGCCGLVSLSMGKSLTFEQSVREAMDLQRNFKCKSPICETQMWKVKHELDLALIKIDRLQRQMGENGLAPDKRAIWRDDRSSNSLAAPNPPPQQNTAAPPIGWKNNTQPPPIGWKNNTPPPIGWNLGGTSAPCEPGQWPGQPPNSDVGPGAYPGMYPNAAPGYDAACQMPTQDCHALYPGLPTYDNAEPVPASKKGASKSLPSSPVKNKTLPFWRHEYPPYQANSRSSSDAMKRATSFPNTRSTNSSPHTNRKTRLHHGNVYMEVDDEGPLEKETVL